MASEKVDKVISKAHNLANPAPIRIHDSAKGSVLSLAAWIQYLVFTPLNYLNIFKEPLYVLSLILIV